MDPVEFRDLGPLPSREARRSRFVTVLDDSDSGPRPARTRRSNPPLPTPGDENASDNVSDSDEGDPPPPRAQHINRRPGASDARPREAVAVPEHRTFISHGLPTALARIATHPGWLDARVDSGHFEGLTGRQILQDEEIHLGRTSEVEDAAKRSATSSLPMSPPAPGSSLVCGRLPPSSLLLSPEGSLLLPSGRFSSLVSSGCSTVLVSPPDRALLLSLDFLVVTETETEVTHSYVRGKDWIVPLPDEELLIGTADPEQQRVMGCGCKTSAVECQGCGVVVGYGLLTSDSCYRHFGPAYAFDPARVRVVPPMSLSGKTKKRKRVNTTPNSLSSRETSPAAAPDLRTGEARQVTTSGSMEGAGDGSGPDGGDTADETAVEASRTETRRVVGR